MHLRIAICDDEPILCRELKEKIEKLDSGHDIDVFHSGQRLFRCVETYDIIFLDIEMPEEDGMETAEKLRAQNCKSYLVFLTSHGEYMPEAFKVKAFRFLTKPIDEGHLKEALSGVKKELADTKQIIVSNFGREIVVDVKDIVYICADRKSTRVHMVKQEIETGNPLKYWISELGCIDFCQTHKSYLVSLRHIRQVMPEGVLLKNADEIIPLSRRKYSAVKNAFFRYIEEHAGIM